MVAWIEITREAWSQWRTNVLAWRVWRRVSWRALPLVVVALVLWPSNWMRPLATAALSWIGPAAFGAWLPIFNILWRVLSVVANPLIPITCIAVGWFYRRTFLRSEETRALPLTAAERLWAVLLPVGRVVAAILVSNVVVVTIREFQAVVTNPAITDPTDVPYLMTISLVHGFVLALAEVPYCGLLALQACLSHGRRLSVLLKSIAAPVVLQVFFAAAVHQALLGMLPRRYFVFTASPSSSQIVAMSALGLAATVICVCIQIPLMASLMRRAMRHAEAELFTPDAVERWEAGRR